MPEENVATDNTQAEQTTATTTNNTEAQPNGEQNQTKSVEEQLAELQAKLQEAEKTAQSNEDRRVQQALKTAQEKWQKEQEEKERLAKLSAEEREKELAKKQQEEVENLKRNLQVKEVGYQVQDAILEEAISPKAKALLKADYYAGQENGMDTLKSDLSVLKEIIQEAEAKAIEKFKAEYLKGEAPISVTGTTTPATASAGSNPLDLILNKLS